MTALPAMDVAGRVDRLRGRARGRGVRRAARHPPHQHPLPHGVHRLGGPPARAARCADLRHRRTVRGAGGGPARAPRASTPTSSSVGQPPLQREAVSELAAGIARLGLEADHVTWADQRRYAEEWFPASALVPSSGLVEALRLVKDDGRGGAHRGRLRHRRRGPGGGGPAARGRPHRDGVRPRARHRDAPAGRRRPVLRDDRRGRPQRIPAAPQPVGSPHRARRPRGHRLRRPRRRLPLRHDPHDRGRRARGARRHPDPDGRGRPGLPGGRRGRGPGGGEHPGRGRGVPGRHRRRPAGARPSCTAQGTAWASTSTRTRGSRGRPMLRSRPAMSSPWNRASTSLGTVGSASRTPSWSPNPGAAP